MRTTILKIAAILCIFCLGNAVASEKTQKTFDTVARVTYYWPGSDGQVGNKTSTGKKAVSGVTASVDPKIIRYGSKIEIPAMGRVYTANDTGRAVVKRTASRKNHRSNIVVDLFCSSRREARILEKKYPMYMPIKVS